MSIVNFPVKPEARPYLDAFEEQVSEPEWLREARRRGLNRFAELGFPSRRSESWRYVDLQTLEQKPRLRRRHTGGLYSTAYEEVREKDARDQLAGLGLAGPPHLVLLDGGFYEEFPPFMPDGVIPGGIAPEDFFERAGVRPYLPTGAWFAPIFVNTQARARLRDVLDSNSNNPFVALNTAFFGGGYVLDIAPGVAVDAPIHIVHLASDGADTAFHTRSLIRLGAGSRAQIIEHYAGKSGHYWRNDAMSVRLAAGAELARSIVVEEGPEAVHLAQLDATLGAAARLTGFALLLGGRTIRHEANVRMTGENARCRIDGAFIVAGGDEVNIVTAIDHAAPGGQTRELVKGVAAGRGHGAFQGRIIVREDAQKTDAHQLSRNLIIGQRAAIDTKPELEIYADDVKCTHGASVGDLDEAALFYLCARGIPLEEARRMLIDGFLREAVDTVVDLATRAYLLRHLARRLANLEE